MQDAQDFDQRPRALPVRTLGDLLNESFAIYVKRFRSLVAVVAVVQVPVGLLGLIPAEGVASFVLLSAVSLIASVCVFGAVVFAVGQHYLVGEIGIRDCYRRVWWRLVSLLIITAILALLVGLGALFVAVGAPPALTLVYGVGLIVYVVFSSMAVQGTVVEGYRSVGALRRSFALVQGSWWRVFANLLVYFLVATGMMIVLFLPFLLATSGATPGDTSVVAVGLRTLGSLIVGVAVPPVMFIAATLLYYDLRVRKEDYDFAALSREMGVATA